MKVTKQHDELHMQYYINHYFTFWSRFDFNRDEKGDYKILTEIQTTICIFFFFFRFAYTIVARTCSEWKERGLTENYVVNIDADGFSGPHTPFSVYCDMVASNGVGVTVIGMNFIEP